MNAEPLAPAHVHSSRNASPSRIQLGPATERDREAIYGIRHEVIALRFGGMEMAAEDEKGDECVFHENVLWNAFRSPCPKGFALDHGEQQIAEAAFFLQHPVGGEMERLALGVVRDSTGAVKEEMRLNTIEWRNGF